MSKPLLIVLAIFIPPLAVYLLKREFSQAFWINVVLTLLGGFPGSIHALYVVLTST